MEISLSHSNWELKGYWPYVPEKEKSMETGQTLHGVTGWIPARVPGGVHADLFRAGLIPDPYFGLNSLSCEWVENRWWMYRAAFPASLEGQDLTSQRVVLVCKGLDYDADVFFNDERVAEHRGGMFVPRVQAAAPRPSPHGAAHPRPGVFARRPLQKPARVWYTERTGN